MITMNLDILAHKFLEVEKKYNLFETYHKKIPLWALLRMQIWWTRIVVEKLNLDQPQQEFHKLNILKKITNSFQLLIGSLVSNPYIGLHGYDLLFLGSSRREKKDGYFYDIYTDFIINESVDYNCLTITRSFNGHHFHPVTTHNIKYLDYINIITYLKSKTSKKDQEILKQINSILEIFANEFRIKWDSYEAEKLYDEKVINFLEYKILFEKLLHRIKPKIIFEIVHYNSLCIALNIVANKMKIPTIEIQHGTINKYHIGYNYSNLTKGKSYPYLPEYIFLFGEFWKNNYLPISQKKQIVTGFPYLEYEKKRIGKVQKEHKQILFISQKLIGKNLSQIAYKLSQKIHHDYRIIYKLHPAEYSDWEKKYPYLKNCKNLKVVDSNSNKSLYQLFAESHYQVGVFSTALFEGLAFNLVTFILDFPGYEYMEQLITSNLVFLVHDSDGILNQINLTQPTINIQNLNKKIWQENAANNIKTAIESILENNKLINA